MDSVSSGVENSDSPSVDRELEPIISKLLSEPDEELSTESVLAPIHRCRFYNAVNNSSNPPQDISDISQLINQLKSVCPTAPAVYLFQPQPPPTEGDVGKVETAFGYVPSLSTLRFHLDNIVKVVPPTEDNASAEATDYENEIPSVTLIQLPAVSFVPWQVSEIIIYDDNVANYYTTNVQLTLEECQQINSESIGRYANDLYVKAKRIRLSSSHFGEVIRRRADINKDFLDKIFFTRDSQATLPGASTASSLMGYQQVMELYKREMAKLHRGISVHPSGLLINPTCPYLAASSDAQVLDPTLDEPHGLLKIIFPNKYRNMNLFEAATKPDFCSPVGPDGKMGLRKTHVYYTQIQGLIALSGLSWCDLVICTKGGVCIERIEREDSHFQNIFGKLTEFYFTKCLPYLADLMENDYRKKKNVAEVDSYALLMPDLCSSWTLKQRVPNVKLRGPILTVEIKPKMGFTVESVGSTAAARTKFCKYSLMQRWKLKNNKISDVSSYCPLDLFSGCPLRLQRALRDLLNNPQNNLRLFLDGKLIYGDGIGSCVNDALQPFFPCESSSSVSDRICSLISEALMRDHPLDDADIEIIRNDGQQTRTCGCKQFQRSQDLDTNHCCDNCRLPLGSILSRILHMQMLSDMDAISILPMYNQWRKELNEYPIEKLHQLLYSDIISLTECKIDEGTPEWVLQKIKLYLLSCTAKDCSIMMTFSNYSEETVTKEFNPWIIREATCVHSIAMVDVDWKSHDRIPQHAKLEENLAM